jgi:hypothetical protein
MRELELRALISTHLRGYLSDLYIMPVPPGTEVMLVTGWQRLDQDGVVRTRTIRREFMDVANVRWLEGQLWLVAPTCHTGGNVEVRLGQSVHD